MKDAKLCSPALITPMLTNKHTDRPAKNSFAGPHTAHALVFLAIIFLLLPGCATTRLNSARSAFYAGQPQKAVEILSADQPFPSRDKLLLFTEKGMILHGLGQYQDSVIEFRKASQLMGQQEIISASRQTASLVTTEWITKYKGEYSERLWVHTYLMMNYLLLHQYENALVEAKQALKIMGKHPESLKNDHFTRALIALCYDNLGESNDAYIEYKKLATTLHDPTVVASDLYRLAVKLDFADEAKKYGQGLPAQERALLAQKPPTELVLFVALGKSPKKIPGNVVLPPSIRFSFPMYQDRDGAARHVRLGRPAGRYPASIIATDLGTVARASLNERKKSLIVKETARVTAKESIAQAVGRNNGETAEALVRMALFIMEEPDTRSWQTLPARLLLLRLPLHPGSNKVEVFVVGKHGSIVEKISLPALSVKTGQRIYQSIRY